MNNIDEAKLHNYLLKCELQYRADHVNGADSLDRLAPHCDTLEDIEAYLRLLGFRIKSKVDDDAQCQWVETTSGVIVYKNHKGCRGLFAKAGNKRRKY